MKNYRPQIKTKWKVDHSYPQNYIPLLFQANSLVFGGLLDVIPHFSGSYGVIFSCIRVCMLNAWKPKINPVISTQLRQFLKPSVKLMHIGWINSYHLLSISISHLILTVTLIETIIPTIVSRPFCCSGSERSVNLAKAIKLINERSRSQMNLFNHKSIFLVGFVLLSQNITD